MPILKEYWTVENLIISGHHYHEPDFRFEHVAKLRCAILRRCREEVTDYRTIFEEEIARVDSDVASQLDFNAMSSAMSRARRSTSVTEVEPQEVAGPSNIESRPCSSKSKIQFVPSEMTALQDVEFGTLEESGMGQFTPTPLGEFTSSQSAEPQASTATPVDETQTTPSSTVVSDVTVLESIDVTQPLENEPSVTMLNVTQPSETNSDVTQPPATKSNVTQPSATKSNVTQPSATKSNVTQPSATKSNVTQPSATKSNVTQPSATKSNVTQPSATKSNVTQPSATKSNVTQLKSAKAQERVSGNQTDVNSTKSDLNAEKLDSAIKRLESVSNKFIAASLADKYDQFGKYISSLLRGLPCRKVNSLKKKLVSQVLEALYEEEKDTSKSMKTIGTQVNLEMASETTYRMFLAQQNTGKSTVSTDTISLANNFPILGGNMPILLPGTSTSSSFQILPVMPMSGAPRVSAATTPSFVNPAPPMPLKPCETVTTVAKSADGTLLAVTLPKSQMTETVVGTDPCPLHSQRGQKRQHSTSAYLIKKCPRIAPKSVTSLSDDSTLNTQTISYTDHGCSRIAMQPMTSTADDSSLNNQSISYTDNGILRIALQPSTSTGDDPSLNNQSIPQADNGTQTDIDLLSQKDFRDSGGWTPSSSVNQFVRQTDGNLQSDENSRDTGGGDGLPNVGQLLKSEEHVEQEFEMDIEEGNELAEMKQDHELFETVMCAEGSDMYIKEEAPDPDETPPLPPSTSFKCPLCNTQCTYRDELERHLATSHTGCAPPATDASGGNYFVT